MASMSTAASASRSSGSLRLILGTMTFAGQTPIDAATQMMQSFVASNPGDAKVEFDTARMYEHGRTEELLGEVFEAHPELRARVSIASKVNPFPTHNLTLTPDNVREQTSAILSSLRTDSVDIMYLHAPDPEVTIEDTMAAVQELYEQGKFVELGLSNYQAWEVAYIHGLCRANGWVVPTVYQAMYNGITREIETELLPCLRKHHMRCYVFNPLAGGLLTGKHTGMAADKSGGRFENPIYRDRFWKDSYFTALDGLRDACDAAGVPMAEAALRWVMHHSNLQAELGDGLIIGASSLRHFDQNMAALQNGPLPSDVVAAIDVAWETCKRDCPPYHRGSSKIEN